MLGWIFGKELLQGRTNHAGGLKEELPDHRECFQLGHSEPMWKQSWSGDFAAQLFVCRIHLLVERCVSGANLSRRFLRMGWERKALVSQAVLPGVKGGGWEEALLGMFLFLNYNFSKAFFPSQDGPRI